MCRTYNFGEQGASNGQFYYNYLLPIKLNDVDFDWSKEVSSLENLCPPFPPIHPLSA